MDLSQFLNKISTFTSDYQFITTNIISYFKQRNRKQTYNISQFNLVMSLQISCTLCSKPFSADNPPRIGKKCPHTYCQTCIKTAPACPMDKIPFDFDKFGLQAFHINRTIVKMLKLNLQPPPALETPKLPSAPLTPKHQIKKNSEKRFSNPKIDVVSQKQTAEEKLDLNFNGDSDQSNKCLLHNKELDLVCIDHAVKVCSNCALFGEHKNHNVKPIQTLIGECACIAQKTLGILTDIKEYQGRVNQESIQTQIIQGFKSKRQEIVKTMRGVFTKIIDKIRKQQRSLVTQLDKVIETAKQQLFGKIKLDECMKKKESWINDAKSLLKIIDSFPSLSKIEEATSYINHDLLQSTLVQRGSYVIVELQMFDKIFQQKLNSAITDIATEVSPSIDSQIENWYKITRTSQKDYETLPISSNSRQSPDRLKQKNEQDQLLEDITQFPKQFESQYTGGYGYNTFANTTDATIIHLTKDLSRPSQYLGALDQPYFDSFSQSQVSSRTFLPNQQTQKPSIVQGKKVKKLKVPQKYENVLQDLISDRSDCIDFTNAQLGDSVVVGLCDYIRGSCKVKILKLIRCKITDDIMQSLLDACRESRITSLNLGQNLLTQETLELMSRLDLGEIKSITLSQNKINQRNSKNKIVEMKARGIVLSI